MKKKNVYDSRYTDYTIDAIVSTEINQNLWPIRFVWTCVYLNCMVECSSVRWSTELIVALGGLRLSIGKRFWMFFDSTTNRQVQIHNFTQLCGCTRIQTIWISHTSWLILVDTIPSIVYLSNLTFFTFEYKTQIHVFIYEENNIN